MIKLAIVQRNSKNFVPTRRIWTTDLRISAYNYSPPLCQLSYRRTCMSHMLPHLFNTAPFCTHQSLQNIGYLSNLSTSLFQVRNLAFFHETLTRYGGIIENLSSNRYFQAKEAWTQDSFHAQHLEHVDKLAMPNLHWSLALYLNVTLVCPKCKISPTQIYSLCCSGA